MTAQLLRRVKYTLPAMSRDSSTPYNSVTVLLSTLAAANLLQCPTQGWFVLQVPCHRAIRHSRNGTEHISEVTRDCGPKKEPTYYIQQVNGVKLVDILFSLLCVCLCALSL